MQQQVDLLVRGGLIVTMNPNREVFRNGYLAVSGGRIVGIGQDRECRYVAAETVDGSDMVVLPGFVNAHSHLIGGFVRGLGGDQFVNVSGTASLRLPNRVREAMDEESCYHGARLSLLELQKSGVTTTADSQPGLRGKESNSDGTLRAISESGIRALFTRASQNRTEFLSPKYHDSLERALVELDRLHGRWSSDLVEVAAEAQGLHRVEEDLLLGLKEWTRRKGVHFAMHISYSQDAANHSIERYGKRLLTLLDEWNVLDEKFLGFHPIWLDDDEINALARTGAGVAYCPVDNMLIACGVAPIAKLQHAGVRLGLGVDQPNDGHNFFELMKLGLLLQRISHLDPGFGSVEVALEMGTIGGARAMHRDHEVGSLEAGKLADFLLLDARRSELSPFSGRLSNIVLAANPAVVDSVFVAGRPVVRHGRHTMWNEEEVVAEANRVMQDTFSRAGLTESDAPFTRWPIL